jgi:hypothetical protein
MRGTPLSLVISSLIQEKMANCDDKLKRSTTVEGMKAGTSLHKGINFSPMSGIKVGTRLVEKRSATAADVPDLIQRPLLRRG